MTATTAARTDRRNAAAAKYEEARYHMESARASKARGLDGVKGAVKRARSAWRIARRMAEG
jgi:hypothetical protein